MKTISSESNRWVLFVKARHQSSDIAVMSFTLHFHRSWGCSDMCIYICERTLREVHCSQGVGGSRQSHCTLNFTNLKFNLTIRDKAKLNSSLSPPSKQWSALPLHNSIMECNYYHQSWCANFELQPKPPIKYWTLKQSDKRLNFLNQVTSAGMTSVKDYEVRVSKVTSSIYKTTWSIITKQIKCPWLLPGGKSKHNTIKK